MNSFLQNDTDAEMDRYQEANEFAAAAFDPMAEKVQKLRYNSTTRKNDIVLPMQAGGFFKIGEADLPQPDVMDAAPEKPLDMRVQDVKDYNAQFDNKLSYADIEAAGMDREAIMAAGILPPEQGPMQAEGTVQPTRPDLSENEITEILANGGGLLGRELDPSLREEGFIQLTEFLLQNAVEGRRQELVEQAAEAFKQSDDTPRSIPQGNRQTNDQQIEMQLQSEMRELRTIAETLADGVFGYRNIGGIGVGDFMTAGVMDIQEGYRMYMGSINDDGSSNSNTERVLGLVVMAAGVAEATGVGYGIGKLIKASVPKLRAGLTAVGNRLNQPGEMPTTSSFGVGEIKMPKLVQKLLTPADNSKIAEKMGSEELTAQAQVVAANQKNNYPEKDGWSQSDMVVIGAKQKNNGSIEVDYKKLPYNFHLAPEGTDPARWEATMVNKTMVELRKLAKRAAAGDKSALAVIDQANWYRTMRARMRAEFGGLGDLFADLLGTTSAQTGVTQNYDNAIEIMRRFSRGEFDQEIKMYEEMLASGTANPVELGRLHKDPDSPFQLITKASGSLFNANSPSSTKALLDMFRVAKGAPKTPNFTGNLIGYTNAATVDVWAARFLRRLSGQKRLPPPTEQGVSGDHMSGSTLSEPKVGGEFGFGQRVLEVAVNRLNKSGEIKTVAPQIGNMGADDLQAVLWFLEKEIWTENKWTSKAGEGGSLDLEASYAGNPDQEGIKTLRTIASKSYTPPKALKQKADESDAEFATRMDERNAKAKEAHDLKVSDATKALEGEKSALSRYVLGVSIERPMSRPTNQQQAEVAAKLGEPAKVDDSVVTYQVNNTYGRFMQSDERAFNAEFVVRDNFDPSGVRSRMIEVGKEFDQDAVFISKVVPQRTSTSRPGVEIYFSTRKDPDFARDLSDQLTAYNVDGFTFITDSRVSDQPARQALQNEEAVAGITGLRFQYIPEFDVGADAWKAMSAQEQAAKIDEVEDIYDKIVFDLMSGNADISTVNLTRYETDVIERGEYDANLTRQIR